MLVMGNEETLAGFPIRQSVPLLVQLLSGIVLAEIIDRSSRAAHIKTASAWASQRYIIPSVRVIYRNLIFPFFLFDISLSLAF